ncbi:PREDICTED: uncharacterized protein K02A2.6-like [Rhagoletis zephyria]|uniref:uncharacterized protein K02A2.6-like n=1 Tax=Rhagoletis zephyria TaxID=28612 RepID=UPI00081125D5|nr:PREDICTED: uncharacterized protein K02A2.6-like [Rhagoletis zephyria]
MAHAILTTKHIRQMGHNNKTTQAPRRKNFDTGSDITIISEHTFDTLNIKETEAVDRSARSATGELPLTSQFTCSVSFQGEEKSLTCRVSSIYDLNVMGLDWIDAFNLKDQPINSVCNQVHNFQGSVDKSAIKPRSAQLKLSFSDVFDSKMGLCNKTKAVLQTKPNVQPVFRPKRSVAYAMQQLVETELQRLQDCEIISPLTYSDWADPLLS